jgi:hypothetical protein
MTTPSNNLPELPEALQAHAWEQARAAHPFPPAVQAAFYDRVVAEGVVAAVGWLGDQALADPALWAIVVAQWAEANARMAGMSLVLSGEVLYDPDTGGLSLPPKEHRS